MDEKVLAYGEELKEGFARELLLWEERVDGLEKELEASNSLVELMEAQVLHSTWSNLSYHNLKTFCHKKFNTPYQNITYHCRCKPS